MFMQVLLLFTIHLTLLMGVKCDIDCERPSCNDNLFVEYHEAYEETGNKFPSDDFFVENCEKYVDGLKCMRNFTRVCEGHVPGIDMDAVVNGTIEFCDEASDLRKGYAANVDCFNSIDITAQACAKDVMHIFGSLEFEQYAAAERRGINQVCVMIHIIRSCTAEVAKESCNEEAKRNALGILERVEKMYQCKEEDREYLDTLISSVEAENPSEAKSVEDENPNEANSVEYEIPSEANV